jgi:hypothetical protein
MDLPNHLVSWDEILGRWWTPQSEDMPPQISFSNSMQLSESQISCLYLKNTKNSRTTKIEGLPTRFEGQDHQEKRHTNLICDSQHKSRKETPLNHSHKNPQKRFRKSPNKINGRSNKNPWGIRANLLYIPLKIHTRSNLPPQHPSLSQDLTTKLSS